MSEHSKDKDRNAFASPRVLDVGIFRRSPANEAKLKEAEPLASELEWIGKHFEKPALVVVTSLAFDGTEKKLTMLQFGKMERRSLGPRRWHVSVPQQSQIAAAVRVEKEKF